MPRKPKYDNLSEAIIEEAMRIIEASGIEQLSMREVSRRLGVSHQAPYKHFPSRDHIHAEIVRRSFEDFARYLDAHTPTEQPDDDLRQMGYAYVRYALENPLQYRLMFGAPLPDCDAHPAMMQQAQHAFNLLRKAIARMDLSSSPEMDALFVWSTMHGLASLIQTPMLEDLDLSEALRQQMPQHVLMRIGTSLQGSHSTPHTDE